MSSKPSTPARRSTSPPLTARQQDAQARNKDPYASSSSSDGGAGNFDSYGNDSYEAVALRREAAAVLDSAELLMMHAQARRESIVATRYYFTKQLCGYPTDDDDAEGKGREKGKEREREGGGGGGENGKEKENGGGKGGKS